MLHTHAHTYAMINGFTCVRWSDFVLTLVFYCNQSTNSLWQQRNTGCRAFMFNVTTTVRAHQWAGTHAHTSHADMCMRKHTHEMTHIDKVHKKYHTYSVHSKCAFLQANMGHAM